MKVGDTVQLTEHGHSIYKVSAYAAMKGTVTDVYPDNAFAIDTGTSIVVCPANDAFKNEKKYIVIILNGVETKHKFIHPKKPSKVERYLSALSLYRNLFSSLTYN